MTREPTKPSVKLRLFMILWRAVWLLGLPVVLFHLRKRGKADPLYWQHLRERFGTHRPLSQAPIWVHAVSLGEMRSAVPLIRAFLARGETVITTHFTPAGRREAERVFAAEITQGRLRVAWVPFDHPWMIRRFLRAVRPKFGLLMEVELWPGLILTCKRAGFALYLCNGQFPPPSYQRALKRKFSRRDFVPHLAGAMVKGTVQQGYFEDMGQKRVQITGELRFDQPIPPDLAAAGHTLREALGHGREVLALTSVVEAEEPLFLDLIGRLKAGPAPMPLVVYIPRAQERFDTVHSQLQQSGVAVLRRSEALDDAFRLREPSPSCEVLLGDSLGEMYGYLAMADRVIVSGGFTPKGSHNIIEPLVMGKPVIVGPEIRTIAFPAEEAIAAGVCQQVTAAQLFEAVISVESGTPAIADFVAKHGGATQRIVDTLETWKMSEGAT